MIPRSMHIRHTTDLWTTNYLTDITLTNLYQIGWPRNVYFCYNLDINYFHASTVTRHYLYFNIKWNKKRSLHRRREGLYFPGDCFSFLCIKNQIIMICSLWVNKGIFFFAPYRGHNFTVTCSIINYYWDWLVRQY